MNTSHHDRSSQWGLTFLAALLVACSSDADSPVPSSDAGEVASAADAGGQAVRAPRDGAGSPPDAAVPAPVGDAAARTDARAPGDAGRSAADDAGRSAADDAGRSAADDAGAQWLSRRYPADEGIATDPAVLWHETFEQDSVAALAARYDQARTSGMSFSSDVPAASSGGQSLVMAAGGEHGEATDLYALLPGEGHEQIYVRYYIRYEDAPYHHSGMWLGGYEPPTAWPNPRAGTRPEGDERFSVAVEPVGATAQGRRMDFYNYWMGMRSWMDEPSGGTAYFGNAVLHRDAFEMEVDRWMCIEIMVRLNDDPGAAGGGELAVWRDDELIEHFTESGPLGYWIRDKFCPAHADSDACLNFAPPPGEREQEPLDLRWRSSSELKINHIWPQNYISSGSGSLQLDDMVVATERIGCLAL